MESLSLDLRLVLLVEAGDRAWQRQYRGRKKMVPMEQNQVEKKGARYRWSG